MLVLLLVLSCRDPAPGGGGGGGDAPGGDTSGGSDSGTSGGSDSGTSVGSDSGDSGASGGDSGASPVADLRFDPAAATGPLLGLGGQIWADDDAWPAALDPMHATLVRIALNPNLGASGVTLPVDATAAEWDAWMAAHVLDRAPSFLDDLAATRAQTDARGMAWVAHQWEAPPAWERAGVLRSEHVDDYAALWGALLGWLDDQGIRPEWIELSNEPDGDWNSNISPDDYSLLVVSVRAELDARGLSDVGIVGPGLSILGSWTEGEASPWVPALSDDAVAALAAWSVHTWDGYAEDDAPLSGPAFLEDRWATFLAQVRARDPDKPVIATELGSKDLRFDGVTYGDPGPEHCGASTESHGYAVRVLGHTALALAAGVDGILYWQAVDQDWECSRWGLLDGEGRSRLVHEAVAAFTSAVPADGRVVVADEAALPAVAVLGEDAGVVLVVNEADDAWSGTVEVVGGWEVLEVRQLGLDSVRQRDELSDLAQLVDAGAGLGVDGTNADRFTGDAGRLYRTAEGAQAAVWSPGGTLVGGELVAWSWDGAAAAPPVVEGSADGEAWTPVAATITTDMPGWHRHRMVLEDVPDGTRWLRVVLDGDGPVWTPQLGDATLDWARDEPGAVTAGAVPWTLELPPDSGVVLVVAR